MPSFDVVSDVDLQEVRNAVDQTNREAGTRFDFKNTGAQVEFGEKELTLSASTEDRLRALYQLLEGGHRQAARRRAGRRHQLGVTHQSGQIAERSARFAPSFFVLRSPVHVTPRSTAHRAGGLATDTTAARDSTSGRPVASCQILREA